ACRLHAPRAAALRPGLLAQWGIEGEYAVATLHRAENTVQPVLAGVLDALAELSRELPIVLPLHPRTHEAGARPRLDAPRLRLVEPLGYLEMLALVGGARMVLTDSGGLQE